MEAGRLKSIRQQRGINFHGRSGIPLVRQEDSPVVEMLHDAPSDDRIVECDDEKHSDVITASAPVSNPVTVEATGEKKEEQIDGTAQSVQSE